MSQPALKPVVSRLALQRVATPVPRTVSRLEQSLALLSDADARIAFALPLLGEDVERLARIDMAAFLARATALLLDIDAATLLANGILAAGPTHETAMRDRVHQLGEHRTAVRRWMRQAGAPL